MNYVRSQARRLADYWAPVEVTIAQRPITTLALCTAAFLLAQLKSGLGAWPAMLLITVVFIVACLSTASRRAMLVSALAVAALLDVGTHVTRHDSWSDPRYIVMTSWVMGAAAVGDAVRNRRAYIREMENRAREAELSREHLAQRRVSEERLRIARDVHDLVAHHIAVINVQAGVASHLIERQPPAAKIALAQVRGAARSALDELACLLGVLRAGDDVQGVPLGPAPTVADMPSLLESFQSAGLSVELSQLGACCPLPPTVDLTAYRLIQESLTNAHKHGSGRAALSLNYEAHELIIDVTNHTVRSESAAREHGGHGLLGMRERVSAIGGTVQAGPTEHGRFHVHARLPLPAFGTRLQ